ncbi:MAG: tetratricopeptide repeat protein [Phycisphaerales bacterium]|nr:MAG: tetratricopeptide repeat protein [Phycisphaerales bacterium]
MTLPDPPESPESQATRRRVIWGVVIIVLLALTAYIPAINGGFIWDDDDYVTKNPLLRDAAGLVRLWEPGQTHQYYPVVFTTFWIEYQLWELDPLGYHLVNVLLHIANALLVWRLMCVLGIGGRGKIPGVAAWMVAAVFALHPVHVESVAWITERKNVLSALFYLLAALSYLRFDPSENQDGGSLPGRRWSWYAASILLFTCALLSKSVTCSLPAALILLMLYRRQRMTIGRLWPLVPLFVIGLVAALHTAHLEQANVGARGAEFDLSFIERTLIACRALVFYPWKLLIPWPVMFIYPRWSIDAGAIGSYWPVVIVLAVGIGAVVAYIKGRGGPFIALTFYAGTVFPALGFFNVYPHRFSFVADHFQYLASLGVIALVITFLARVLGNYKRLVLACVVVLPALWVITWTQACTYQSAETVWRDTLAKNDNAWMAHNNLAGVLLRQVEAHVLADRLEEAAGAAGQAEHHARRAAEIKPDHHPARSNLSEALRLQGRFDEALAEQRLAVDLALARLGPAARQAPPPFLASEYYQLGRLHQLLNQRDQAEEAYRRALEITPQDLMITRELAGLLVQMEKYADAAVLYARVVERNAKDYSALVTLAGLSQAQGDYAQADRRYQQALTAAANELERVQIVTRLIHLYTTCPDPAYRKTDRAIELAGGLVGLSNGQDPAALDVLAAAYAAAERFEEAVAATDSAIEIARERGLHELAQQIGQRREEYELRRREKEAEFGPAEPGEG